MLSKAEIRQDIKKKQHQFTKTEQKSASSNIAHQLKTYLTTHAITQVALFYPTTTEPQLPINWLLNQFTTCYAPKYIQNNYQFVELIPPYNTKKGHFNIDEPTTYQAANPDILYSQHTAVLVPGIAFTNKGHRIGHGAGIYDRLLPPFKGPLIGLGFNYQIVNAIPKESHDINCHVVIYEKN
tara:strand:- start:297 stop:842 length:546 start_codon:yes stop_codon:yes gene_type:complete